MCTQGRRLTISCGWPRRIRPGATQYVVKGVKPMKLTPKALPVLSCLNIFMSWSSKAYCFPSQARIVRFLEEELGLKKCRRQLNRDLKFMCEGRLIRRVPRHRREKGRGMVFHSTLYEITVKGWHLLYKVGIISKARFASMVNRFRSFLQGLKRPGPASRRTSGLDALGSIIGALRPPPG